MFYNCVPRLRIKTYNFLCETSQLIGFLINISKLYEIDPFILRVNLSQHKISIQTKFLTIMNYSKVISHAGENHGMNFEICFRNIQMLDC